MADHNSRAPHQKELDHLLPVSGAYLGKVLISPTIVLVTDSVLSAIMHHMTMMCVRGGIGTRTGLIV